MKKLFKYFSFRFKIISTLILVIATISFFSFMLYGYYLGERIQSLTEEHLLTTLSLLKDQYLYTFSQFDGKIIYSLLGEMQKNKKIRHIYLFNNQGKVVYPEKALPIEIESLFPDKPLPKTDDILITHIQDSGKQVLRSLFQIENTPRCYQCHSKSLKTLGYVIIDYSMEEVYKNIKYTKNFGQIFTFLLLVTTLFVMILVHYKFVRKSLKHFQTSISKIEQGDLDERVKISEQNELGNLAKSFNNMVEKLQQTQEKLQACHQKELLNAQKLATVGEMAASLAHEIKNPITGIANAIEIIVQETEELEKKSILEEIKRQAQRVNKAINDLLQFSRPVELYLEKGDINTIINSCVSFLKNHIQDKEITFQFNLDKTIPPFRFDHIQIENSLYNLGLNAIQAIPRSGMITIITSWSRKDKVVWIKIQDTGVGIPEDHLTKIFKPFFTTRHKGTGLGLAITKDIIERHGGEIWAENRMVGGSSFNIMLPLIK